MTFDRAKDTVLPFGQHKGQTIFEAAGTDDGLCYLDWMRGVATSQVLKEALETYLGDLVVERELANALECRKRRNKAEKGVMRERGYKP